MPRLGGAVDLPQVGDPATPAAGRQFLYFKADGVLYTKKPDGTVVAVAPVNMVTTDTAQTITGIKSLTATAGAAILTIDPVNTGSANALNSPAFLFRTKDANSNGLDNSAIYARFGTTASTPYFQADRSFRSSLDLQAPAVVAQGLTGATAASRYVGATATGAPTTGTFVVGDYVIAQNGGIYVCIVAGTPGTWIAAGGVPANMVTTDTSQTISGQKIFTNNFTVFRSPSVVLQPVASADVATPTINSPNLDFYANYWNGTASAQITAATLAGVVSSTGDSHLNVGVPIRAQKTGSALASRYAGATAAGAPTTGAYLTGDFIIARDGQVWICTTSGTPGTWVSAAPATMVTTDTVQTVTGAKTFSAVLLGTAGVFDGPTATAAYRVYSPSNPPPGGGGGAAAGTAARSFFLA